METIRVPRRRRWSSAPIDITASPSASHRSGGNTKLMTPRAVVAMKLMISGVTRPPAAIKAPRDELDSSSRITTIPPARNDSVAAATFLAATGEGPPVGATPTKSRLA